MTIAAAAHLAAHRRMLRRLGESVTLRRLTGTTSQTAVDATVTARVTGYRPQALAGGIQQGDRELIVLAEDLVAAGWPVPPKKGDRIILRPDADGVGETLTVQAVDSSRRRVGGVLIAYEITARG